MLLGVGGLTLGLAAGGAVLVAVLGVTLQRSADAEATQTGRDVARLAEANALPNPLPVAGEQLVQVVDEQNRVLAASIGADRLTSMLRESELARVRDGERLFIDGDRIGARGPVRVVGVPVELAGPPGGPATVVVAKPMADLRHSLERMRAVLLVAFPMLVLSLAWVAWRVVGATLRPVEALRAGAAEISEAGRPAKLPVPDSHDEIYRLATTLNDMLDRLDAARAKQRAFVADAAHELRSPLANMRTQLEVAQHLGDRTDWPQVAADLLADTQRLARLVDDLLLLARADDARVRDRAVEPVELGGVLRAVAERCPPELVTVVDCEPAWTEGDPEALRRVVANLADNAVRHARSRVELAVTTDGDQQLVTVTDDGPGIPQADRERVFDRFTRLDDARARDAGGAGLGLAIVRELVRRHGGTVRLTDADGGGLRVEVRLPAAQMPSI
ncbi:MAG TPA: HAMP domain-containing sensor histidine kinase [Natronosporangium sp.]